MPDQIKRFHIRLILAVLVMLSCQPHGIASNGQLTVIELTHRPASEVIPIIAPLLTISDRINRKMEGESDRTSSQTRIFVRLDLVP